MAALFQQAAFDGDWDKALSALADVTGANASQLIGVGADYGLLFNRAVNIDPAALELFAQTNGSDPARNARVRAGLEADLMLPMSEADFGDVEAILNSEIYREIFRPAGIAFSLQATIAREPSGVIGAAVLHDERHGLAQTDERERFAAILPAIEGAVRLHLALEGHGARVLTGAFDALGLAAFICDAGGRVTALSAAAAEQASRQTHLRVLRDRLHATHPADARSLASALARAGQRGVGPVSLTIPLRSPINSSTVTCEVASLPLGEFAFGLEAGVLVVVRAHRDLTLLTPMLRDSFGLTPAECEVAQALAAGAVVTDIAQRRGVSVGTIRNQLKSTAAKLGVSRQAELVAKLNAL